MIIAKQKTLKHYHNKKNKINPVPKAMRILNVVHDVSPTF